MTFNDTLRIKLAKALNMPIKEERVDEKQEIARLVREYEEQQVEEVAQCQ